MQNKMVDKPKIVFLLESISQPRCIKRVKGFIDNGYDVEIHGIDRGIYNENNTISEVKINIFDKQRDGKDHIKKLLRNYKAIKKILNNHQNDGVVFYSFGFALTLSLLILGSKKYIYEMSDVLYGYRKYDFLRPFLKKIDKAIINRSLFTVFTSEGFVDFFFKKYKPNNIIVQPNKLSVYFSGIQRPNTIGEINYNNIKFAYVGVFRFPNTIFRFAKIVGEYFPEHEFHFYGDSALTSQVIRISEKYDNVIYHGSFKNPDDLTTIYNNIDILISCYDTQDLNVRVAEPNKLYESLFFNKPIVVSKDTFLSKKIERINCGYSINALSDESIVSFIGNIKNEDIVNIQESINRIPKNEIIDDNSTKLISYLEKKLDHLNYE